MRADKIFQSLLMNLAVASLVLLGSACSTEPPNDIDGSETVLTGHFVDNGVEGLRVHYGARPLKRLIQRLVQDPLAMRILEGEFPEGSKITADIDASGNALEFHRD